jgi:hypothetical protein
VTSCGTGIKGPCSRLILGAHPTFLPQSTRSTEGYLEPPNWSSGMMINPELVRFAVASLIGLLNLSGISYLTSRDARKISVDEMFGGGGRSVGLPARGSYRRDWVTLRDHMKM